MKKLSITLVTGVFVFLGGLNTAIAQDDDDSAAAVEAYTCSYADGKSEADLDKVVAKWNKWADGQGMADYSAWTMTHWQRYGRGTGYVARERRIARGRLQQRYSL